jgi:hypothetical protein
MIFQDFRLPFRGFGLIARFATELLMLKMKAMVVDVRKLLAELKSSDGGTD